ncbi:MAG: tetratricopeptide repeat protein, partial [Candidatus Hydrogenedens sp.]
PSYFAIFIGYYFVKSDITLIILPILRDFVRAPFILTVILILFYLIQGKRSNKRFLVSCLLLGLICGIGIGFRRDLMMFFSLSLFILLIIPKVGNVPKIPIRIAGIIITILIFIVSSYPILHSFHKFGTLGWHDILMGFGTEHDDLAGLQRTNYERIPKYNDLLVSATADVHSYYHESLNDYELFIKKNPELEKRNLFLTYLYYFPADIIIRTYSSIARISDRILTSALPINTYRTLLSVAVLVIFMAIDLHKGICFSTILLFAMGIQMLQFNFRHNFYLAFVPYLLYFLALKGFLSGLYHLWKGGKEKLDENIHEIKKIIKRFCIIAFTVIFFTLGILIVARQIQSYQLTQVFRSYETAEQIPISYNTYTTQTGTVYSLEKPLSLCFDDRFMAVPSFEVNIVVVDFLVNKFPACFEVLYDGLDDFSCNLTITRHTPSDTKSMYVRYFIPVYEHLRDLKSDWNRFIGIRIEDTNNLQVQKIYKICNPEHIPLFINYYLVQDELPNLYQKIATYSKEMINPCWKPYGISTKRTSINNANNAFYNGDLTKAYEILQKSMEEEPYSLEYGLALANIYEKTGQVEQAKEVYFQLMSNKPHDPIPFIKLNNLLSQTTLSKEEKQSYWKDIISKLPNSSVAWLFYSKNVGDVSTAKEALSKSISLNRDITLSTPYTSIHYNLKELFSLAMKNEQESDKSLCPILPLHRQISYMLTAGIYTADNQDYQKSLDILKFLL